MRTYLKSEHLTNIEIARILKNHSIDSFVDSNNNIFAISYEYDLKNKTWYQIDVNLTDCTYQEMRDFLQY